MKVISVKRGNRTFEAKVDDADYPYVASQKWFVYLKSEARPYLQRNKPGGQMGRGSVFLHRELMGDIPKGMDVDHANGDTLDNRRCNLRLATRQQNSANARLSKRSTSGYKGVTWAKRDKKWRASIYPNRGTLFLGHFDTAEEAARAYDLAAKKHFGEFAKTNFN